MCAFDTFSPISVFFEISFLKYFNFFMLQLDFDVVGFRFVDGLMHLHCSTIGKRCSYEHAVYYY